MKLRTSNFYFHRSGEDSCPLEDCVRAYCPRHRLLYRVCETALAGYEGDPDIPNGTRAVIDVTGDCPTCNRESKYKRMTDEIESRRRNHDNAAY